MGTSVAASAMSTSPIPSTPTEYEMPNDGIQG